MAIELWLQDAEQDTQVIHNAAAVPQIGATMDTDYGIRKIVNLHYDYDSKNGELRVHVALKRT